jgi:hypothetical protein
LNQPDLERLAREGLAALPPLLLPDIANDCWDRGAITGDARYCLLWRSLDLIAQIFEDRGQLPTPIVDELNGAFARLLPGALDATTAEEGTGLARILDDEIRSVLAALA